MRSNKYTTGIAILSIFGRLFYFLGAVTEIEFPSKASLFEFLWKKKL